METICLLDQDHFGKPSFEELMNIGMRIKGQDVARAASSLVFINELNVKIATQDCFWTARLLLRSTGLIPYAGRPDSQIPNVLSYVIRWSADYNWRRFFGSDHASAEWLIIVAKQRFETDIDAFVVSLDSFCDLLTQNIFRQKQESLKTPYGNIIGHGAPGWFRIGYPNLIAGFHKLHELRIRSFTAHPRHKGTANKRISHRQFHGIRKHLALAFDELSKNLPM